ncbi:MAG: hypothetical protein JWP12_2378 [Bacteroidetes bacterium]|nr:hypothetical protein [Bacteroidota bacterium]
MGAALYNSFPFVTSDSGTYIASGFLGFVPYDRPIVYGLFIRFSSMASSLWFTIIFQAIILSFIVWQVINKFSIATLTNVEKFSIVILISMLSSISWYASQIMPDIFTPVGILAFLLLLFSTKNKFTFFFNSIILLLSCLVHNSNLVIFSMLTVGLILYGIFSKSFKQQLLSFRRSAFVFMLVASAWIIAPGINYAVDGNYRLTGSPGVFLMAKNVENGIMDKYLARNCGKYLMKTLPDSGTYLILAKNSKKVVDVEGVSKADNAALHIWQYMAQPNQQFKIIRVKDKWYKIISLNSDKCVQLNPADTSNTGYPVQGSYTGADNQLYTFITAATPGHFNIVNKQSGKMWGTASGNLEDGTPIQQYVADLGDQQEFQIIQTGHCLCMYKDELPNSAIGFLWDDHSVFSQTGNWKHANEEYSPMLHDIFFSPNYFGPNVGEALSALLQQLTRNDIGDGIVAYDGNSSPFFAIRQNLPYEIKSFSRSRQNLGQVRFTEVNKRNFWLLIFSTIIILFFFQNKTLRSTVSAEFSIFIKLCLLAIVINAFVTGAMANVLDRLQSRVSWCIPLMAAILVFNTFFPVLKKRLKTTFSRE